MLRSIATPLAMTPAAPSALLGPPRARTALPPGTQVPNQTASPGHQHLIPPQIPDSQTTISLLHHWELCVEEHAFIHLAIGTSIPPQIPDYQ
jgi:hypothetical protein